MSTALRTPRMTVAEFENWQPPTGLEDRRWELIDGEPACMAPPSDDHGAIQSETSRLIGNWLVTHRPDCRILTTPGVIPRLNASINTRVPDLGITCGPRLAGKARSEHIILIEILSPTNAARTRSNVWAYSSIPSVQEIVLLSSTSIDAELFRRLAGGDWSREPARLAARDRLHLASIGYAAPLAAHYATSSLGGATA